MTERREQLPEWARRVGVFGGTFDPVHIGHLILAERALDALELDLVLFIPARVPPHKRDGRTISSGEDRVEMLRGAIESNPRFLATALELERDAVSFTYDTMVALRAANSDVEFTLLIGADNLEQFGTWHRVEELATMVKIGVWARPGSQLPEQALPGVSYTRITAPLLEISGTEIRRDVLLGCSIRYRVPEPVRKYIDDHGLYR